MIERRTWPKPEWTGTSWLSTSVLVGENTDRGGGPLGPFAVRLAGVPAHLGTPGHMVGTSVSAAKALSGNVNMGLSRKAAR